jgi:hypothetical protein
LVPASAASSEYLYRPVERYYTPTALTHLIQFDANDIPFPRRCALNNRKDMQSA